MIYREIPGADTKNTKEIREKLIPSEVTHAVSEAASDETSVRSVTSSGTITHEEISIDYTVSESEGTPSGLVNLNTADMKTLMTLKGIGEKKAQSIIEYRNANGAFTSTDELVSVPGIGKKTAEAVRDSVTV